MRVIRLKARAYASELLCGKIQLSDVPPRIRLKDKKYYIYALRYFRYDRTIPNPLETWKSDIASLADGADKDYLQFWWECNYHELENENVVSLMGPLPAGIDMCDPDML